ncbi:MAG: helix-turn-helix domain-containing protein, partial [Thaumarchaeota archaeon]|nr:helix-turn-helix domain-containing protein [Nitrososphaerota archaeon]
MSEEELSFLERASRGRDYKLRVRARMILLSSGKNGLSARRIASQLGVHRHTVEVRIRRFNESGVDGLKDFPLPGRVPRITAEEKESIFRTALSKPNELGLPYSTWS